MYFPRTIYQTAGPGIIRYNEFPRCASNPHNIYISQPPIQTHLFDASCTTRCLSSHSAPLQWRQIQNLFFSFTLQNDHRRKYPSLHPLKAKVLLLYLSRPKASRILTLSSGLWSLSRSFARPVECLNGLKYFDLGMGCCRPQFLCPPWGRIEEVEVWLYSFLILTLGRIIWIPLYKIIAGHGWNN